ncbi:MAG: AEC family transporter [Clostridiales bacterium]|nr:AEC family transporter [Clostridiales bacterium]
MTIDFSEVIIQLLIMLTIIITGIIAKRFKILDDHGDRVISSLIVNVTTPALIISAMTLDLDPQIIKNIIIITFLTLFVLVLSWIFSIYMIKKDDKIEDANRVYRFAIVFGNASFLGFPLCYALFGKIGLLYASIYSAMQDIFFWSAGVSIMTGGKGKKRFTNMLNPNMAAIVIGIIILFANIKLPVFLDSALSSVGDATMPLALMMVGSGFSRFSLDAEGLKSMAKVILSKLIILPIIVGALILKLPIDDIVKYVLLLEFAMPTAASTVVMSRNFDRDYTLASKLVMITTLISMVTIPLLIFLAKSALGLSL